MTEKKETDVLLYGRDLFGEPMSPIASGPILARFGIPPFSVLDARSGDWQERKQQWLGLGIKSEIGRGTNLTYALPMQGWDRNNMQETYYDEAKKTGTSVFDPVLCELVYRWFSPFGGQVIDPFAGGSVRGIIAGMLKRRYWGCDLMQNQIDANNEQADKLLGNTEEVKISAAMLRQMFHPCEQEYVRETCKGRCCEGTDGIKVTIHASEW